MCGAPYPSSGTGNDSVGYNSCFIKYEDGLVGARSTNQLLVEQTNQKNQMTRDDSDACQVDHKLFKTFKQLSLVTSTTKSVVYRLCSLC